ncbi:hypothetical protein [Microbacterium ulmi]|uniref:Uncharacterized protein n=1 Tax=Microbacterium ulmi TaxID=179095 RepID=A0A7Y2M1X2_9MICO|nr:hypothetical protein [Microbacterium ulmi]NII70402.1 hypothetical protein [Microbacterium ulmi]NNH04996.1 hypothetical protein [Microbacterium ulmi]
MADAQPAKAPDRRPWFVWDEDWLATFVGLGLFLVLLFGIVPGSVIP